MEASQGFFRVLKIQVLSTFRCAIKLSCPLSPCPCMSCRNTQGVEEAPITHLGAAQGAHGEKKGGEVPLHS